MAQKTFNGRIINKHDTEANWLKAVNFIPQQSEIIVYDIDETYNYERFKIGDGITPINSLPFIDEGIKNNISDIENQVEDLYNRLNSNAVLSFYCVEDVTIVLNGVSTTYPANSNVEIKLLDTDTFEIVPTSDNSILTLNAFPGALGTYYSWLEGVKQFSNILFDMNAEDMYTKWNQDNQGAYQVQYAQYSNCIFWSDNPYISDVTKRTNYTLYNSAQLPLCYSSIPDNTFKAFYLALGVINDPNWSNPAYKESFAKATWATQVFSYYGARVIGTPEHFSITLPNDCRGLMFYARNTEAAGTFDATNVTNFGAKSGSWRDAFGYCSSLRRLYIENLKVNLNVSWSPIDYESIYYIISEATNTSAITISVSPYTYNLLSASDFELATSKNITIELLSTNYVEDKRLSDITNKADKTEVLLKTEQTLTDNELTQVRKNLKFIGKNVEGQTFTIDGEEKVASPSAEIFGNYDSNIAIGQWSIAEGNNTKAIGNASHAEGNYTIASSEYQHVQGKYNIEDTANVYAHIVGKGTADNARANAHTVNWSGNGWYAGDVYTGGTSIADGEKLIKTSELTTAIEEANSYTDIAVANLVNSAPETLDTLGELATALQENENVVYVLNEAITTRVKTVNGVGVDDNGNVEVREMPEVTEADNGKFLVVVNGVWAATSIESAEGVKF